jgi:hypothetical protein
MKKLMDALNDLQHEARQAGEEIADLEGFKPKKAQKKIVNIMYFVEELARQIEAFFEEMRDQGKAELSLEFAKGLDPWTIFGDDEEQKKPKVKKPTKKK